jgi:guanylate kinase
MITFEMAAERQASYSSLPEIRQAMAGAAIIAFVGPTAVGKSYLMERSGYPRVGTLTTRGPRPNDTDDYRYVSMEEMLAKIEAREVVQYGPNRHTRTIYASEPQDYNLDRPNVMDVLSSAMDKLQGQAGYGRVRALSVVTIVDTWEQWFRSRFEDSHPDVIAGRLDEAEESLNWTIRNGSEPSKLIVMNSAVDPSQALTAIDRFISYETVDPASQNIALEAARDMLAAIPRMREEYLSKRR